MKYNILTVALIAISIVASGCKTIKKPESNFNRIDKLNIEKSMLKALEWQEANPIFVKSPKDWTNGAYYTGVAKAHEATKNPDFLKALTGMAVRNDWQPFDRINSADDIAISYAYVYLKSINAKDANLVPSEDFVEKHLAYQEIEKRDKPLWWWCDALFMAPPVLTQLAKLNNNPALLDAMYKNYKETYDLLYDKNEHLFARDDRFVWKGESTDKKEKNGKKIFWSRGNGWVLGGLALVLEDMPENYTNRPFFLSLFKEMSVKVKSLQQPDGMWTTSLLSPESYNHSETSGSGFFTFALAWGVNNGILKSEEYKETINKAWAGLMTTQLPDGKIGFVQNIGFDPRPATAESWQNYGTGAFLLAGSEVLKMK